MFRFDFFQVGIEVLFWVCFWVQIGVIVGLLARFAFFLRKNRSNVVHFQPQKSSENVWPAVSIILCARNEAQNLRQFLPSFCTQDYAGDWELILVNDASTDETAPVMAQFAQEYPKRVRIISLLEKVRTGKKQALQKGIEASRFPVILLSDADCQPGSQYWVKHMLSQFLISPAIEIVLGYGPNFPAKRPRWPSFFFRYETAFTAAQYFSCALAGMPYMGVGRNLAFQRTVFDQMGGFSSHAYLSSGDDDLFVNAAANARNTAICVHPEAFVYSSAPQNLSDWLQQKRRHLSTGPAYRWWHQIVLGLMAFSEVGVLAFGLFSWILRGANIWIFAAFLAHFALLWVVLGCIFAKIQEKELRNKIPFLHLCLVFYWGIWVPWVLWFSRGRVGWK